MSDPFRTNPSWQDMYVRERSECDRLTKQLTAEREARKTAEQELEKNRTSFKICCGAAGVADESELCGAIDRMKQRAEDAEKACALLRQEVFETRCFDLKGACSAGGHGKRDAEIVAIVNERLDAEIQSAGRDYVAKSKLDEARKALDGLKPIALFGKAILDRMLELYRDACSSEYTDAESELAATCGLAEMVEFDPEKHGDIPDAEPGSKIWWFGTKPDEAAKALAAAEKFTGGEA